jgi:hypothetical protein
MSEYGLFEKYGNDAINNKYFDNKQDREIVIIDYRENKEEKEVVLIGRYYDSEIDKYGEMEVSVDDIIEKERFEHIEGGAELVK